MKTRTAKKVIVLHAARKRRYRASTIVSCARQLRAAAKREQRLTDPSLTLMPTLPHVSDIVYLRCSQKQTAQWYTSRPAGTAGMTQRALFPEKVMPSWAPAKKPPSSAEFAVWPGRHHIAPDGRTTAANERITVSSDELTIAREVDFIARPPSLCSPAERERILAGLQGEPAAYATRTIQEMRVHQIAATDARRSDAVKTDLAAMRAHYAAEETAES